MANKRLKFTPIPVDIPAKKEKSTKEVVADTIATTKRGSIPALLRLASGGAGSMAAGEPGIGTLIGAGLSGAGELGAQTIENWGTDKPYNWPRVGVEAMLGAVPMGSSAKASTAALKGGAMGASGAIARKATDEDPNTSATNYNDYGVGDILQVGLGAGLGGLLHRFGNPTGGSSESDAKINDLLSRLGKTKNAGDIALENPRLVKGVRVGTEPSGNPIIQQPHNAPLGVMRNTDPEAPVVTEARQKAVSSRNIDPKNPLTQVDSGINESASISKAQRGVNEKGDKAFTKRKVDVAKAMGQGETLKAKEAAAAIKQKTAAAKASKAESEASIVQQHLDDLLDNGAIPRTSVSKSASMDTPEGRIRASTRYVVPPEDTPEALPAIPKTGLRVQGSVEPTAQQPKGGAAPVDEPFNAPRIVEPKATPPAKPTAKFAGYQPTGIPGKEPIALYSVSGGPSDRSTVAAAKLAELGIDVPMTPPVEGWTPNKPPSQGRIAETRAQHDAEMANIKAKFDAEAEAIKAPIKAEADRLMGKPSDQSEVAPEVKPATLDGPSGAIPVAQEPIDPELLARQRIVDPTTNQQTYQPGFSKPEGLILQPKEGGGYIRDKFDANGIQRSETANPKPVGSKFTPEPLDLEAVRADLGNIQDPLVRQMAERELASGNPEPRSSRVSTAQSVPAKSTKQPTSLIFDDPRNADALREAELDQRLAQLPETATDLRSPIERELTEIYKRQLERGNVDRADVEIPKDPNDNNGGTTLGFGLGGAQDILDVMKRNPQFAARAIGGVAGAGIGGAMDDKDPLRGALLGGAAGAMAPSLFNHVEGGAPSNIMDKAVNWQRFSLLSNPTNLLVNTIAPTGGGVMSSIEKMVQGALGDQEAGQLGRAGLGASLNLKRLTPSNIKDAWQKGSQRIADAESSRADMSGGTQTVLDRIMALPANLMTMGDESTRDALQGAGWSEAASRAATLTNEPRYALTGALANLSRTGGWGAKLLLPFVKTAANAVEGGIERTPILGLAFRKATEDAERVLDMADPEILARQGTGLAASTFGYYLGTHVDPDTSKQWKVPYIIANMGGQYGPLMVAAYQAGQARQTGSTGPEAIATGAKRALTDLPLPSTEPGVEAIDAMQKLSSGEPLKPDARYPFERYIPDNFLPRFLRDESISGENIMPQKRIRFTPIQ